jgi:hypothetical protein
MIWLSEFMISVSSSWQERSKSKDCKSCSWDDSSEKSAALADCSVRTKKLLNKKVKKYEKKLGSIFAGLKTGFFRASCFGLFWF